MIYLFIIILLIFLSYYYDIYQAKGGKKFWYYTSLLIFILVAGLRFRVGADTTHYLYSFYHENPDLHHFSIREYSIGRDPGWVLLNSIVKYFNGKFYVVQLIHSAFLNFFVFKYLKKHCTFFFTALFFYYIYLYTSFNMEIMRASISIAICLYANDYIIEKKWILGYVLYVIALLFHSQGIVFLFLPFLFFIRLNRVGLLVLISAFIIGFSLQSLIGNYLYIFDENEYMQDKLSQYTFSESFGEQIGSIGYIILRIIVPSVLATISLLYIKKHFPNNALLKYEPFVMMGLVFSVIQLNFQIAYRILDYFRLYFVIFYSEFFVRYCIRKFNRSGLMSYVKVLIIFSPLFLMIVLKYYSWRFRYFPYNSVIERKLDKNRESYYTGLSNTRITPLHEY